MQRFSLLGATMNTILIVTQFVQICLCCYSSYDYYNPPTGPGEYSGSIELPKNNAVERNKEHAWNGWTVPENKVKEWKKWLQTYMKQMAINEANPAKINDFPRGPGSGWPPSWMGLGGGLVGWPPLEMPPWAHVPVNSGLPSYCYLPPLYGNCSDSIERWAYNPFTDQCEQFTYTGCHGNENRFSSKEGCFQKCIGFKVPSGCDYNTDLSREKTLFDITRRDGRKCGF